MLVGCYSADAYCDCADHPYGKPGDYSRPATFVGRNKRECDRARRQDGWVRENGQDVCPLCKTKRPIRLSLSAPSSTPPRMR